MDFIILNQIQIKNGLQLELRQPVVEDAEKMIEYLNKVGGESDNLLFGKDEFHLTIQEEAAYIESINSNPNTLMILGTIEDSIVSVAQISTSARKRIAHNSEIAISVKKEYWKSGVGTAVMNELIKFAKESEVILNVSLGVRAGNRHAIRLYENCGFETVGVHKDYFYIDGVYYDEILMDLRV